MKNSIESFSFENTNLRIINNEWFVAKDICDGLGIKDSAKAVRAINTQLKEAGIKGGVSSRTLVSTSGGKQKSITVNETGLNMLIMQSRKKEATKYKYWLASEVLPSIRKTGAYVEPAKELTLTPAQQNHIQHRVKQLVAQQIGTTFAGLWGSIKDSFKVGTYKDIPARLYPDLCDLLQCKPIDEAIEPSNLLNLPEGLIAINETRLDDLASKIDTLNKCISTIDTIYAEIVEATNEVVSSINYPRTNSLIN